MSRSRFAVRPDLVVVVPSGQSIVTLVTQPVDPKPK